MPIIDPERSKNRNDSRKRRLSGSCGWPCGLPSVTPEAIGELLVATGRRGTYGVDTHSGLHHRKRGSGVTSAQRVPCRRKSNLESQDESATAVLRRRTGDARRNWLPTWP